MLQINRTEWRDNNENTAYPFSERATLSNVDGVRIDRDLFSDARLYPIGATEGVFLNRITVDGASVTLGISDPTNGELASGTFDVNSPPGEVVFNDAFGRPAGILVSSAEKLQLLLARYGQGTFEFEAEETEFAPSVVIPMPEVGVRGVLLDDGNIVSGDLYLVGADGIVLEWDGEAVRVDAVGDPYALVKRCAEQGVEIPTFCGLKTINKIGPNTQGNFIIRPGANEAADPVISVDVVEGQIKISRIDAKTGLNNG